MLFEQLLGPEAGFIGLRLVCLTILVYSLMKVGLSRTFRFVDGAFVATVLVFAPLVLRAIFVDYSDFVIVTGGVAAIVVALYGSRGRGTTALLGALLAVLCIANAFAVSLSFFILIACLLNRQNNRQRLADFGVIFASGVAVVIAGWAFFRVRYGIPNVYSPTIDFVRTSSRIHDLLRSPRHEWLFYRLWIYLPPLVLVAALALWKFGRVVFGRAELLAFTLCGTQYLFQVWYQFARTGTTLEIHYYFTYAIPPLLVATAIVLYELVRRCSVPVVATLTLGVVVLWLNDGFPARFSSWRQTALVVLLAGIVAVVSWEGFRSAPALLFSGTFLALQLAYPANEPSLPNEQRVSSGYDTVWKRSNSLGPDFFHQTVWFMNAMDRLGNDVEQRAGFVLAGGAS